MSWASISIPLAIIERIFHVEYPVLPEANPWTHSINRLLIEIGARMYQVKPFTIAAIGEEAGVLSLERISGRLATDKDTDILAPERLFRQMKIAPHGTLLAQGLWWTGKKLKHG